MNDRAHNVVRDSNRNRDSKHKPHL